MTVRPLVGPFKNMTESVSASGPLWAQGWTCTRKRTRLNRNVLIGKLAHPAAIREKRKRGPRKRSYSREVQAALIKVWELFDYPCGQRLAPALRQEVARLRQAKELVCSNEVAAKLEQITPRSIDRLLGREKRLRGLRQNRNPSIHPLLYHFRAATAASMSRREPLPSPALVPRSRDLRDIRVIQ